MYPINPEVLNIIKVAIYEDNADLLDILSNIITESEGFSLVGAYSNCMDIVENSTANMPDVILMDIDMPGKSGIVGVGELKAVYPKVEVLMNTVFDDDDKIFDALKAGATGYLLKKNSLATLLFSLKDIMEGGAPISSSIARKVLALPFIQKEKNNLHASVLSERELTVLQFLSKGLSYKMVADEIHLSIDTIRTYVKRIYEKLHVHSVTEAVHKVFIDKN